jgi:hypothetical protein
VNRTVSRIITAIVKPIASMVGLIAGPAHKILFSKSDQRLAIKHQNELAEDIRKALPFLFSDLSGRIEPNTVNTDPPPFDHAIVTVHARDFHLRFTRGRGALTIQVAPFDFPNSWHELSTILTALDIGEVRRGCISDFAKAGELLNIHNREISVALTGDQFARTREKLQQIYARDRLVAKQLETEVNRRLYPDSDS